MKRLTQRAQRGFTLIELMVMLIIIGVLAALIVPNVLDRADDARVTAARTNINNLMHALKLYKLENQRFPSADQELPALLAKPTADAIPPNWRPYVEKLPNDLEQSQALKAQLMGAALYPAIVTLVAIAIVMFLLGYVAPQVAQVFAGSKRALPLLTVIMLGLGSFVRNQGWLILGAIVLVAACARAAWANATFRLNFDTAWLKLPVLGRLARGYNAARFASTLAMLAAAGMPILKALQAAAETLSNRAMRADALDALVLVREGAPLAAALGQKNAFRHCSACLPASGNRPASCPPCSTGRRASSAPKCSAAPCNWPRLRSHC